MNEQKSSLLPEASQDRINVLERLVDLSSFFSSCNSAHDSITVLTLFMKSIRKLICQRKKLFNFEIWLSKRTRSHTFTTTTIMYSIIIRHKLHYYRSCFISSISSFLHHDISISWLHKSELRSGDLIYQIPVNNYEFPFLNYVICISDIRMTRKHVSLIGNHANFSCYTREW